MTVGIVKIMVCVDICAVNNVVYMGKQQDIACVDRKSVQQHCKSPSDSPLLVYNTLKQHTAFKQQKRQTTPNNNKNIILD